MNLMAIDSLAWAEVRRGRDLKALIKLGCSPSVAAQIAGGITYPAMPNTPRRYVYIAGPMRGYEKFNFPAFDAARDVFVQAGWCVISPADIDRRAGCTEDTPPEQVLDQRVFVYRDFFALFFLAHSPRSAIALLPNWERSTGASAEKGLSKWLGLQLLDAMTQQPLIIAA